MQKITTLLVPLVGTIAKLLHGLGQVITQVLSYRLQPDQIWSTAGSAWPKTSVYPQHSP